MCPCVFVAWQGRPDHPERHPAASRRSVHARRAAPAAVEDRRRGAAGATTRRPRRVHLLLVPPRAAPPLPLHTLPLAPPRIHCHRAYHMYAPLKPSLSMLI